MNTFGRKLTITTFGESHGEAIGAIIDGFPAGIKIDIDYIQSELEKRRSKTQYTTPRKEEDKVKILSGIFNNISIGTPIALIVENNNTKSHDYDGIKDIYRPGHADFTYFKKFGINDYKGGGRSSARETVVRVAAGAIAQLLLNEFNITVSSGIFSIGKVNHNSKLNVENLDFVYAQNSEIFSLIPNLEDEFKNEIKNAMNLRDSIGGSVVTIIKNAPAGLGEVLYDKFDARLAQAMMGINGVKAVEIGSGIESSSTFGSLNNDNMDKNGFLTNNSGGILGGITNSNDIVVKSHFKPTPSIFLEQKTLNKNNKEVICALKGRHDPCIAIRGSVVATSMVRLVCADMLLLNASSKVENLKKIYS